MAEARAVAPHQNARRLGKQAPGAFLPSLANGEIDVVCAMRGIDAAKVAIRRPADVAYTAEKIRGRTGQRLRPALFAPEESRR